MQARPPAALPGRGGRVEITIHYSTFDPSALTVPRGVPITFVLVNEDPIDHEWLIGDAAFHERTATGRERVARRACRTRSRCRRSSTVETTLTFDEPGEILYICHFPSHEAYGMVGTRDRHLIDDAEPLLSSPCMSNQPPQLVEQVTPSRSILRIGGPIIFGIGLVDDRGDGRLLARGAAPTSRTTKFGWLFAACR